jgi:transposase
MDVTNHQWEYLVAFIPEIEQQRRACRPYADARTVLNGVLWILRTGAPWKDLPPRYGSPATVHRRFQRWQELGVLRRMVEVLAEHLHLHGRLDLRECFVDGTFAPAKKGALAWENQARQGHQDHGSGRRSWRSSRPVH